MIREVRPEDTGSITAIYNEYVAHSVITFETEPVREEEMRSRITGIVSHFPTSFMKRKVKLPGTVMPMPGKKERLTGIRWKQPFIWHPNIKAKE